MKIFISAIALAGAASAHTTLWGVTLNGKDLGFGNAQGGYIDTPPNNSPVTDVTSKNMECNVPNIKAAKAIDVMPGDEMAMQWYHNGPTAADQIIDGSHKGPIAVYIAKDAATKSWVKIWHDGWDGKKWAVTKLRDGDYNGKKGQHVVKIPSVAAGKYVVRAEIIALHEGNRAAGAQFYMECIHVNIGGSGSTTLPAGVAIPGYVTAQTPGVLFDIYNSFTTYPIPGPAPWSGAGGAATAGAAPTPAPAAPAPAAPAASAPAAEAPSDEDPSVESDQECSSDVTDSEDADTPAAPAPAPATGGAVAQKYAQCGGQGFTGASTCASGTTCTKQNDYYSQCL